MRRAEFVLALCGIVVAVYEGAQSVAGIVALLVAALLLLDSVRRAT